MRPQDTLDLIGWINEAALRGDPEEILVKGVCKRLVAAGFPVWRAVVGTDTLHPVIGGSVFYWTADEGPRRQDYVPQSDSSNSWETSPFFWLYKHRESLLRRADLQAAPSEEFPILNDLRDQGATDYVAMMVHLGEATSIGELDCIYLSFTSRDPAGFGDKDVGLLGPIVQALSVAVHGRAMATIAQTLVETYLGRDAGHRVLRGHIRPGVADRINAVLWFSDLQGFTRITDSADSALIIPMLNDYADALVTAIHGQGGQVLKFIGDGILAIFDTNTSSQSACDAAIDAAEDALVRCVAVNRRRKADGLPVTRFYLGLHMGEVLYGNVGSSERLDFTVVGPAVNEASRIAAMCRSLDQDILLSSSFAAAAPACADRLISVGRYLLRGVGKPQELFTLDPDRRKPVPEGD